MWDELTISLCTTPKVSFWNVRVLVFRVELRETWIRKLEFADASTRIFNVQYIIRLDVSMPSGWCEQTRLLTGAALTHNVPESLRLEFL